MKHWIFPIIALTLSACGKEGRPAVLPDTLTITAPSAEVPPEFAAFSGNWSGKWGDCLPAKLAVLSISATGAVRTYYAWGDCIKRRVEQNGDLHSGLIDGNVLRLDPFVDGSKLTFTLTAEGTLDGKIDAKRQSTTAVFKKDEPAK